MLFHQARLGKRDIYFTSIAEPSVKFLRYMQQFPFFDDRPFDHSLFFADLSGPALSQGLEATIAALRRQIADRGPAIIAIDSFKALRSPMPNPAGAHALLYELVLDLAVSDVTAFAVGEYSDDDISHLPEFYAAGGITNLSRQTDGLRVSRQLELLKLRGSDYEPGRHFFEISAGGITVYPRVSAPAEEDPAETDLRISTGVAGLDEVLEGGLPALSSTVLEGGSGTGKTHLALGFLVEGARQGEPGLLLTMDESRSQLINLGITRGWDMGSLLASGLLEIVHISPLKYVADALLQQARDAISRLGAKRVAIDSLSGLRMSIAAEGRSQELVYALVKTFRALGVTSILTNEIPQLMGTTELSSQGLIAIADNIVMLRYVEIEARLARAISVLKVRGSGHDDRLRELIISADRVEVGSSFQEYRGVLTGIPTAQEIAPSPRRRRRGKSPGSQPGESPSSNQ